LHLLAAGGGSTLLFYLLALDVGINTAVSGGLVAQLALLLAVLLPQTPARQTVVWHVAAFTAIICLTGLLRQAWQRQRQHDDRLSDLHRTGKALLLGQRRLQEEQLTLAESTRQAERSRMLKGIHDTLGHVLTAIIVQLSAAMQALDRPEQARTQIENARNAARDGLADVRSTIGQLDDQGRTLAEQLLALAASARADLSVEVLTLVDRELSVTPTAQALLLSAFREGLTNGVRHGQATAFVLRIERQAGQIRFDLEDNGQGCPTFKPGYGLTAMEEMAGQLGGTLEASSLPEAGFALRLVLPDHDPGGA
jgi:signal transduction histidine kinase